MGKPLDPNKQRVPGSNHPWKRGQFVAPTSKTKAEIDAAILDQGRAKRIENTNKSLGDILKR